MSNLDDILGTLPIDDIAKRLGVDPATAEAAARQALPALIGGLAANAEGGGADSITRAVERHGSALVDGGVSLADVDTDDGEKIVDNVFGAKKPEVVAALGSTKPATAAGGISPELIGKLLPILAPIVLSFLAKQFTPKATGEATESAPKPSTGGGIGDLLGSILGGGSGSGGGGLGDLLGGLGGLLGGGKR